jgi:hypothetical protein
VEAEALDTEFHRLLRASVLLLLVYEVIRIFEVRVEVFWGGDKLDAARLGAQAPGTAGVLSLEGLLGQAELRHALPVVELDQLLPLLVRNLPDEAAWPCNRGNRLFVTVCIFVKQAVDELWAAF